MDTGRQSACALMTEEFPALWKHLGNDLPRLGSNSPRRGSSLALSGACAALASIGLHKDGAAQQVRPASTRTSSSTPWAACASPSPRPTWRGCWRSRVRCARALPRGFVAFGEVGLAGEVRPAPRGQERLREAAKLGFSVAVVPKANAPKKAIEGLTIHAVDRIEEAIEVVRGV
jgi:hypothetical protein